MTSVMGSSPAHFCGPPKPPSGARGRDHGAHVPRISRPPPSRFVFLYRWLPPLAGHDWHVLSINRAGRFTDASFGLDHRSARSIGTRFRPLTRFFGANEQRHRVEHRPLLRTAQAPIWRPRMRSTGRASLGLAALPFSIFCFFTGGYLVWPGTIGTRARSTGPVVLTDAFFGLADRSARSIGTRFRPLTRLFGANDQSHGVEPCPLLRPPKPPSGALGMRSTGRASLGFAALPLSVFSFRSWR